MSSPNFSLTLPHLFARSVKSKFLSVRWMSPSVAVFSLLLAGLPAQAVDYLLSDTSTSLPPGCTIVSPGNYSCGVLTLGVGDTISIGGTQPATLTFTGAFTTGASNLINASGLASNLTLVTIGVLSLGADTIVNANVTGTAAVNLGIGSTLGGNLTTASPTGVVTLGANSKVGGFILTDAGAVNVGDSSNVGAGITTQAGVVTLEGSIQVGGGISTTAGAISIGGLSNIGGGLTTQAGVVTLGASIRLGGGISTTAGAITIGSSSNIGAGIITGAGVVTLATNIQVGGDIRTVAGAITIGDGSSTCGSVITTGAGVVTLTTNVKIGGDISSVAGAITVGSGSSVGGYIIPTGAGVVTLTGVAVSGNVTTGAGAITLTDSRVGGSVGATGAGVVTITNSVVNDITLVVPPGLTVAGVTNTITTNNTQTSPVLVTSTGTLNIADGGRLSATTGITVNSGGTLLLSNPGATANTDRIHDSATLNLAGPTALRLTNSEREGFATVTGGGGTSMVGIGALTLSANSTIDFDSLSNGNLLVFAGCFNPGLFTVTVTNWHSANFDGSMNSGQLTDDRLIFNQNMTGFLSSFDFGFGPGVNVSQIALDSGFFEIGAITPVPEPSSVATVMGLLGIVGWRERGKARAVWRGERRAALANA